jgi:hypothetical protein
LYCGARHKGIFTFIAGRENNLSLLLLLLLLLLVVVVVVVVVIVVAVVIVLIEEIAIAVTMMYVKSARLSVCIEQLGSHWADYHEI